MLLWLMNLGFAGGEVGFFISGAIPVRGAANVIAQYEAQITAQYEVQITAESEGEVRT